MLREELYKMLVKDLQKLQRRVYDIEDIMSIVKCSYSSAYGIYRELLANRYIEKIKGISRIRFRIIKEVV